MFFSLKFKIKNFMFNKNTKIKLKDNSGAKVIKCIHSYNNFLIKNDAF